MRASYAVVWREPAGTICTGSVEAGEDALHFRGAAAGCPAERVVRYVDIVGARTLRTGDALIDGRTTLLLEVSPDECLHVAAVAGVGALAELAALLSSRPSLPSGAGRGPVPAAQNRMLRGRMIEIRQSGETHER